jgi:hypothetical protein
MSLYDCGFGFTFVVVVVAAARAHARNDPIKCVIVVYR